MHEKAREKTSRSRTLGKHVYRLSMGPDTVSLGVDMLSRCTNQRTVPRLPCRGFRLCLVCALLSLRIESSLIAVIADGRAFPSRRALLACRCALRDHASALPSLFAGELFVRQSASKARQSRSPGQTLRHQNCLARLKNTHPCDQRFTNVHLPIFSIAFARANQDQTSLKHPWTPAADKTPSGTRTPSSVLSGRRFSPAVGLCCNSWEVRTLEQFSTSA